MKEYKEWETIDNIPTGDGYLPIVYAPEFMYNQQLSIVAATKLQLADGSICSGIVVDNGYLKITENLQILFLLHELGHIINGDIELPKEELDQINHDRLNGLMPEMEFLADEFAIENYPIDRLGNMLTDLNQFVKNIVDKFPDDVGVREFRNRHRIIAAHARDRYRSCR